MTAETVILFFPLSRLLRFSVAPSKSPAPEVMADLTWHWLPHSINWGPAKDSTLSIPCFLVIHAVEALRGSGGDEQTAHLIYNKAHCNLPLTTSYYPSGWCAVQLRLALTFLSKKLSALWIRGDILFGKPFVFSAAYWSYWGITFFLFSPSKETNW